MPPSIERKYRAGKDFPFWLYDPEGDGVTFYRTGADRDRAAANAIALYLDTHDGWNEDVERVSGGLVTHHAVEVDRENKPAKLDDDNCDENGEHWPEGFDDKCDYKFKPLALTWEATELEGVKKVIPFVDKLLEFIQHGDYSNGVTADGGIDEGRVGAYKLLKRYQNEWKRFLEEQFKNPPEAKANGYVQPVLNPDLSQALNEALEEKEVLVSMLADKEISITDLKSMAEMWKSKAQAGYVRLDPDQSLPEPTELPFYLSPTELMVSQAGIGIQETQVMTYRKCQQDMIAAGFVKKIKKEGKP